MKKGVLLILSSAMSFTLATVFAKIVNSRTGITGIEITFFRFLLGLFIVSIILFAKKESLRPNNIKLVVLRAITNTIAALCFFTGVQYTTVTNANMLNMTYPVFVYILSPFITGEKNRFSGIVYLMITLVGVYLVTSPDFNNINIGDLFAFCSAIVAGNAISILRQARKFDNSIIILFYVMALGTLITFFIMLPVYIKPEGVIIVYMALSAAAAVAGQFFLTVAYRFIDAQSGSLVSSSRLVFAGGLGVLIFGDPLSISLIIGALLILLSLAGVSGILQRFFHEKLH